MVANEVLKQKIDKAAYSSISEMHCKSIIIKQMFMKRLVNQNKTYGFCQCQFSHFNIVLQLHKMLPLAKKQIKG